MVCVNTEHTFEYDVVLDACRENDRVMSVLVSCLYSRR